MHYTDADFLFPLNKLGWIFISLNILTLYLYDLKVGKSCYICKYIFTITLIAYQTQHKGPTQKFPIIISSLFSPFFFNLTLFFHWMIQVIQYIYFCIGDSHIFIFFNFIRWNFKIALNSLRILSRFIYFLLFLCLAKHIQTEFPLAPHWVDFMSVFQLYKYKIHVFNSFIFLNQCIVFRLI